MEEVIPIVKTNKYRRWQRNAQVNYCQAVEPFYKWRLLAPNSLTYLQPFFAHLKTLVSNQNIIRYKS